MSVLVDKLLDSAVGGAVVTVSCGHAASTYPPDETKPLVKLETVCLYLQADLTASIKKKEI